ncbi:MULTISPECIES: hypothetical protein [Metabacillus]|uniref:Uncharacterized protein n=1 Tax=Metabacillus hrfriensis TaxID=3048891 RepID=A0ACD4RCA5_9BACI|nr:MULTISPECIES: hypothetical protein [Metabacillus]UAL52247.1 hypothetical protein K8L98_24395 [Metabacillus dongyingensis]UOK58020.1 hypothetical protein MGI18_00440 [Bacillus sp. OVS6]USK28566.1 hypothetical protein LIT32_24600 [Bacillus sp. CMF21]WHZ57782.1 hypothetical protein QLQ22_24615 [Metabacillus sp. CT-WN-B3]
MNQLYKEHVFDSAKDLRYKADPLNFQLETLASAGVELSNLIRAELAGSTAEFIAQISIELTKLRSENEAVISQQINSNHMLAIQYSNLVNDTNAQYMTIRYDKKEPVG